MEIIYTAGAEILGGEGKDDDLTEINTYKLAQWFCRGTRGDLPSCRV